MLGRVLQLATLICLGALSLLYPLIELVDRWDAPGPSSDSELEIIIFLTFVGIVFLLRHLIVSGAAFILAKLPPRLRSCKHVLTTGFVFAFPQPFTASPPLALRI